MLKKLMPSFNSLRWGGTALLAGVAAALCLQGFSGYLTTLTEKARILVFLLGVIWFFLLFLPTLDRATRNRSLAYGLLITILALLLFGSAADVQSRLVGGTIFWTEVLFKAVLAGSSLVVLALLARTIFLIGQKLSGSTRGTSRGATRAWAAGSCLLSAMFLLPYLFSSDNIHRFKVQNTRTPQSAFNLPYQSVQFEAAEDKLMLQGWFIPSGASRHTVLVCHGLGANRSTFLGAVPFLHARGYNVFMFDFRGHGASPGHTTSFGFYEARDVLGAVRYLRLQPHSQTISALGFSMGGAALMHAAPQMEPLEALVLDSSFADFPAMVLHQTSYLPEALSAAGLVAMDLCTRLELGLRLNQLSPGPVLTSLRNTPVLIVHGTRDTLVPVGEAAKLLAFANPPTELWLIEGANHCLGLRVAKEKYEARVGTFLGPRNQFRPK